MMCMLAYAYRVLGICRGPLVDIIHGILFEDFYFELSFANSLRSICMFLLFTIDPSELQLHIYQWIFKWFTLF